MSKDAFIEYVESLSGVIIPPEQRSSFSINRRQKPKYDEETIFNNPEIIQEITESLYEESTHSLIYMYHIMNNWHMPLMLAKILQMPTYLYDQFNMLPMSIKNKSIEPLMKILKKVLLDKAIKNCDLPNSLSYEDQTWEEYMNEH